MTKAIDLFNEFASNEKAEIEGAWEPYAGDVEFLIARANNKEYDRLITKEWKRHERLLKAKNDAAEAKALEITIDVMAQTVLLNWRNAVYKGAPMPYSVDNAKTLLAHKDFREWVSERAVDAARFRVEAVEDVAQK